MNCFPVKKMALTNDVENFWEASDGFAIRTETKHIKTIKQNLEKLNNV